jgi:hypothetical protein
MFAAQQTALFNTTPSAANVKFEGQTPGRKSDELEGSVGD